MKKMIAVLATAALITTVLSGCRESDKVSYNISQQADNFNVTRKITVINVRDDTILYELVGNFALTNEGNNELSIISEVAPGSYKKDYIYLSEWTTYIVQDVSGAYVDQYHYEVNILPQMIGGVTITSDE
ncbi:hypothetical protein H7U37_08135 [Pseudoflavonifractor phocaeensis]|uniref:beta-sandwich lipoprotein n=1 Tax=Pseudoflavonifractor phocaeensis TaxID=1870988 RepID=UPI001957E8FB|nr:hypothetical protein [Pseudoflavonifractor phocaeensis]MBM6938490.1 hypothetical protein [Pseudoflavonifractor phocaeensis]